MKRQVSLGLNQLHIMGFPEKTRQYDEADGQEMEVDPEFDGEHGKDISCSQQDAERQQQDGYGSQRSGHLYGK